MPHKDPKQLKAYKRRWYEKHRAQHMARSKARYTENKDAIAVQRQTVEGRAKRLRNETTRRARKLGQFLEDVDPRIVYQMHGGMCGICKEFVSEDEFEVDHVIPLAKGGLHGYINVQPAHPICNRRKATS